jgi:hypothetical protein
MSSKTIYLDTFALINISADRSLMSAVKEYIDTTSYILIVGIMNLIEIYSWPKRWSAVSEFVSSVPFCIAQNPEKILPLEIQNYPNRIDLPVAFCSLEHSFSQVELKDAIEINLKEKIASFGRNYRSQHKSILKSILKERVDYAPDENGKYSTIKKWIFMQTNVLKFLFPDHTIFVEEHKSKSQEIKIECIKSAYIQVLIIFLEYYVQRKEGKPSDIGDIYQLAIVPYVDLAVVDNERNDLFQRINRDGLFTEKLNTCNFSQFKKAITAY